MTGGEILIIGKLLLTFGCLLGLPLWDLICLERLRRRRDTDRRDTDRRETDRRETEAREADQARRTTRS